MEKQKMTIEQALAYTGREASVLDLFKLYPEKDREHYENDFKLKVFIEAFNKEDNGGVDWKPNFNDGTTKYSLWVWITSKKDGVGFVVDVTHCDYTHANTLVGSRHVMRSENVYERLKSECADLIEGAFTK